MPLQTICFIRCRSLRRTNLRYDRFGGIHCSLRYDDDIYCGWGKGSGEYPENRVNATGTRRSGSASGLPAVTRIVSGVFILGWVVGTGGNLLVRLEQGPAKRHSCRWQWYSDGQSG